MMNLASMNRYKYMINQKIPDGVLSLRKCAAVKDKRSVFALNDIWSCAGGEVGGRVCVFVVFFACKNVTASQC